MQQLAQKYKCFNCELSPAKPRRMMMNDDDESEEYYNLFDFASVANYVIQWKTRVLGVYRVSEDLHCSHYKQVFANPQYSRA